MRGNGREIFLVIFSSDFMVENIVHISSGDRVCVSTGTCSYTRIYIVLFVIQAAVFANIHIPLNKTLTFLRSSFMYDVVNEIYIQGEFENCLEKRKKPTIDEIIWERSLWNEQPWEAIVKSYCEIN